MAFPPASVNHRLPSGPTAILVGDAEPADPAVPLGSGNSVIFPPVVIVPILSPSSSVNHRLCPAAPSSTKQPVCVARRERYRREPVGAGTAPRTIRSASIGSRELEPAACARSAATRVDSTIGLVTLRNERTISS
jgi:hypothetical protein